MKVLEKRLSTQMATISQQYAELRRYSLNLQYEAAVKANVEAKLSADCGHAGTEAAPEAGNDPVLADVKVDVCGRHDDGDSGHREGGDE